MEKLLISLKEIDDLLKSGKTLYLKGMWTVFYAKETSTYYVNCHDDCCRDEVKDLEDILWWALNTNNDGLYDMSDIEIWN